MTKLETDLAKFSEYCRRDVKNSPFEGIALAQATRYLKALCAIRARIQGEWDNPALMSFGPLSANAEEDILLIIEEATDSPS